MRHSGVNREALLDCAQGDFPVFRSTEKVRKLERRRLLLLALLGAPTG
jgi:hypothetical protein